MKKYNIQKILIPVDFSETSMLALDHAVFMAKLCKAEITLLHIIESLAYTSAIGNSFGNEFEIMIEKMAKDKLKQLAESIHTESKIKVHTRSEVGRIYKQVVEVAEEIKADIIIMGTHGVSGFREFLMGSNAFRVVSEASCPILSVQTHATKLGFKNIVIPIDDTQHSLQKIIYAQGIADHYGSTLHLIGLTTDDETTSRMKMEVKVKKAKEYFDKHGINCKTKVVSTNTGVAKTVLDYAASIKSDLIISMSEQEFDISGIIMGPTAQQLVNHSKISVMSVRPEINANNIQFN